MFSLTRSVAPLASLVVLSLAAMAFLSWYEPTAVWMLWINWAVTALMAFVVQDTLLRYYITRIKNGVTFLIAWIVLLATANFATLYVADDSAQWFVLLSEAGLLALLRLLLATWEEKYAVAAYFSVGWIIGALSTWQPYVLGWLLLLPVALYVLRTFSVRNVWSVPTGVLLGVWVVYCVTFALGGEAMADAMIGGYARLLSAHVPEWPLLTWQEWIFVGLLLFLLLLYASTSFLFTFEKSIRSRAGIVLLSVLSFVFLLLSAANLDCMGLSLGLLSVFVGMLLPVSLSSVRSVLNDWWIFIVLVLFQLSSLLPAVMQLLQGAS